MSKYAILFTVVLAVPAQGFIDEDPGLYAEEFSIQAERLGSTLDELGAVVEQAVGGDIDEHKDTLRALREDCDSVYDRLSEWERIPDEYALCYARLKDSAIKAGESVDALIEYIKTGEHGTRVKAAVKFVEAFDAYSRALDTYPYVADTDK